jgi:hypothetical protein
MNISAVIANGYENNRLCCRCQNKPNSNPNKANTKPIKANKMPKQTQYKPNQTQSHRSRFYPKSHIINAELTISAVEKLRIFLIFTPHSSTVSVSQMILRSIQRAKSFEKPLFSPYSHFSFSNMVLDNDYAGVLSYVRWPDHGGRLQNYWSLNKEVENG